MEKMGKVATFQSYGSAFKPLGYTVGMERVNTALKMPNLPPEHTWALRELDWVTSTPIHLLLWGFK